MTFSLRALFISMLLPFCGTVQSQIIYKCIAQDKTIYTESPCADGNDQNSRFNVVEDRLGNVTYDRQTIEAARSRIRAGIDERGVGVGTSPNLPLGATAARSAKPEARQQQCTAIAKKEKELEVRLRRRNTDYVVHQIRAQQTQLRRDAYEWAC
ncbi:MAG: hypothetical protein REI95_14465 [Oxalicibacterium faecigallinarum]|uniref:hypothetical protein n=1 Tax=Oxalicibacterium faecigallinarum TaxID=573741 RepID=UPI002808BFAD|nr:hypothetical protein [Oxalicibacterium faecigallinarum]MDQ7970833.1 hypothetical protein [Oxalicibacterium faecigallinarum]